MISQLYRFVSRVSPAAGQILANTAATINGWRFDDVKQHLDERFRQAGTPVDAAALVLSLDVLRNQRMSGQKPRRIAFVSNMPPDDTGIASCSFYSWTGHNGSIDIFCPVRDIDWFVANGELLASSGGSDGARLLDVRAFLTADQVNRYEHVCVAIGNSDHCIYVHDFLRKLSAFGGVERCTLYVHDPCLINVIQKGLRIPAKDMVRLFEKIYDRALAHTMPNGAREWEIHQNLVDAGVFGPRWFRHQGIRRFLVNSKAAETILRRELGSSDTRVDRVFHPVFLPLGVSVNHFNASPCVRKPIDTLTIGTFGIPSTSKLTPEIIAAAKHIMESGVAVKLIIGGFHASAFAEANSELLEGVDIEIHDAPSDVRLVELMSKVDVAVQLRRNNLGESSGVVPQLLLLGKPTVVRAIGSFAEFGDAVITVAPEDGPREIAAAILSASSNPPEQEAMLRYTKDHSPERFRRELLGVLNTPSI
jgi:glycosyltransferase involved in cell wall biosynthesis